MPNPEAPTFRDHLLTAVSADASPPLDRPTSLSIYKSEFHSSQPLQTAVMLPNLSPVRSIIYGLTCGLYCERARAAILEHAGTNPVRSSDEHDA